MSSHIVVPCRIRGQCYSIGGSEVFGQFIFTHLNRSLSVKAKAHVTQKTQNNRSVGFCSVLHFSLIGLLVRLVASEVSLSLGTETCLERKVTSSY